jgi:hypothetical protein
MHGNNQIKAETKATGVVESVFFENGETVLKVDGRKVFLRDVDSFIIFQDIQKSPT